MFGKFFGPRYFGDRYWGEGAVVDGDYFGNRFYSPRYWGVRYWGGPPIVEASSGRRRIKVMTASWYRVVQDG